MWSSVDIGIDLGTANTLIYTKNKGIIVNEPTVVAIDNKTKNVMAVGTEAKSMIGKTPMSISIVRPLKDGVIADFDITTEFLRQMMAKAGKKLGSSIRKPRVMICVPSGASTVERKAIEDAVRFSGAKEVHLIEETVAAAIGSDLPVAEPVANVIIDIGGGTTEVGIISYGGVVSSTTVKMAGDRMVEDIVNFVRKQYNVLIGEPTAESIKQEIGYALVSHTTETLEVRGRDVVTGLPKSIELKSDEIQEVLKEPLLAIMEAIRSTLENCPPELSGDIVDQGVVLTGGGSLLKGMVDWLSKELSVPVHLAPEPLESVAIGTGKSIQMIGRLKKKVN